MHKHEWLMRTITLLGLLCSVRLGSTAKIPHGQSIDSSSNDVLSASNPAANITAAGANPFFRITTNYLDTDIDENDCVMNVIIEMGHLSAKNFTQPIEPRAYGDNRFPSVLIVTRSPAEGELIEPRFLVWGLYSGIKPMIQDNKWKVAEFTLLWGESIVGYISFEATGITRPSLQGSRDTSVQSRRSTPPSDSLALYNPVNPAQHNSSQPNPSFFIDVELTSLGAPIPKVDIFMAVLECFLYLGPKTISEALVAFSVYPSPYDVTLRLMPFSRPEEPFFDYGVASLGLSTVPLKFFTERRQRWTEVDFVYLVDDVLVGRGSIRKGRG